MAPSSGEVSRAKWRNLVVQILEGLLPESCLVSDCEKDHKRD